MLSPSLKNLSPKTIAIMKSCYDAGIWGPFFHGMIWPVSAISVHAGPPIEALRVVSKYWPNLDHDNFLPEYRKTFPLQDVADEHFFSSASSGFHTVVYWIIEYLTKDKRPKVIQAFSEWIKYDKKEVIRAFEEYNVPYDEWVKYVRSKIGSGLKPSGSKES